MDNDILSAFFDDLDGLDWEAENARAAEYNERQRAARVSDLIEGAGIPREFITASLEGCAEVARSWARDYCETGRRNGLLIQGDAGTGKTHTACAALIHLARNAETRSLFSTAGDILREVKASRSYKEESESSLVDRYSRVPVLCIDDLGKERGDYSPIIAIIDKRYAEVLPTIITTQYTGRELFDRLGDAKAAQATVSRLKTFSRVKLGGGDRRGK